VAELGQACWNDGMKIDLLTTHRGMNMKVSALFIFLLCVSACGGDVTPGTIGPGSGSRSSGIGTGTGSGSGIAPDSGSSSSGSGSSSSDAQVECETPPQGSRCVLCDNKGHCPDGVFPRCPPETSPVPGIQPVGSCPGSGCVACGASGLGLLWTCSATSWVNSSVEVSCSQ
jgi:hypothetical protein